MKQHKAHLVGTGKLDPLALAKFDILQAHKYTNARAGIVLERGVTLASPVIFEQLWDWNLQPYVYIRPLENQSDATKALMVGQSILQQHAHGAHDAVQRMY